MTYSIGELARRTNISVETVRYYERKGLLKEPQRKPSGYRQYDDETIRILQFILRAKQFGFTLKEIQDLLSTWFNPTSTSTEIRERAKEKVSEIDGKIAVLQQMRHALQSLVERCPGKGPATDCPIFEAFQGTDLN